MENRARLTTIVLFTSNLGDVQSFYSAIGISWLGGGEEQIGETGLPLSVERCPKPYGGPGVEGAGLPDLLGSFGEVELWFYLLKSANPAANIPNTRLRIVVEDPEKAVQKLKELRLHKPFLEGVWGSNQLLIDPDGRNVELASPHDYAFG